MINNTNIKKSLPTTSKNKRIQKQKKNKNISYRKCNSVLYMASLYKERSKCLVKLPTMQHTVTDVGKGGWRTEGAGFRGAGGEKRRGWYEKERGRGNRRRIA